MLRDSSGPFGVGSPLLGGQEGTGRGAADASTGMELRKQVLLAKWDSCSDKSGSKAKGEPRLLSQAGISAPSRAGKGLGEERGSAHFFLQVRPPSNSFCLGQRAC